MILHVQSGLQKYQCGQTVTPDASFECLLKGAPQWREVVALGGGGKNFFLDNPLKFRYLGDDSTLRCGGVNGS